MKPFLLVLLSAATLAPSCVRAQTNTLTDVVVRPQFAAVLIQPGVGASTNFFAAPAGAPDPMNPQGYGLGVFSLQSLSSGQGQFEIDNLTNIFSGQDPTMPNGNGPVSQPFDIVSDVTLENLALSETFMDGTTQIVALPDTMLDTGTITLFSDPFAFDPATGDPMHGLLASATLTGALNQTNITIAQPAAAPEPGTLVPVVMGSLLLGILAVRRRKLAASA